MRTTPNILGRLTMASALFMVIPPSPETQVQAIAPAAEVQTMTSVPQSYIENKGQWPSQARFLAKTRGINAWITPRGAVYDFHRLEAEDRIARKLDPTIAETPTRRYGHVVRMEFVGGGPSASVGVGQLEAKHNYFLGNDSKRWASNVPLFREVESRQPYDGIDVRWYFDAGHPRYDVIVAPGTDPGKVALRFDGARKIEARGDTLRIHTSVGIVEQKGLYAYQKISGSTREVASSWKVAGNVARFELGAYDPAHRLVIDPLLGYTYLGGSGEEWTTDIEVAGNDVVVCGSTPSADFPTTVGAYDQTLAGRDGFVSKLKANGSALVWSTFLGGSLGDDTDAVAIMSSGSIVCAGGTGSDDFPLVSPLDSVRGNGEIYVARLSSDGSRLVFSTFYGGSAHEYIGGIAVDSADRIIVAGTTESPDFYTVNAFDSTYNGGLDVFVAKLMPNGSSVLFSTYMGGPSHDTCYDVAIDPSNRPVIVGTTNGGFPTTLGSPAYGGNGDCFVTKLNANGSSLRWSRLHGGTMGDVLYKVCTDSVGGVGAIGFTLSADFPTTPGSFSTPSPMSDAPVLRYSANGNLVFSALLGGNGSDVGAGCKFDSTDKLVVCGGTNSSDFPMTPDGFLRKGMGGSGDGFVAKFNTAGTKLLYGTLFGGADNDYFESLTLDGAGRIQVFGHTRSAFLPPLYEGFDTTYNGGDDAIIVRFDPIGGVLNLSPRTVVGGVQNIDGKIVLPSAAPAGGTVVELFTTTLKVSVPNSVLVPAGSTTKSFVATTDVVFEPTQVFMGYKLPSSGKSWIGVQLLRGGLASVVVNPDTVKGGFPATGTAHLTGFPGASGATVKLTSSHASVVVPNNVVVADGFESANFSVTTSPVGVRRLVTITAKLGTTTRTCQMAVNP